MLILREEASAGLLERSSGRLALGLLEVWRHRWIGRHEQNLLALDGALAGDASLAPARSFLGAGLLLDVVGRRLRMLLGIVLWLRSGSALGGCRGLLALGFLQLREL